MDFFYDSTTDNNFLNWSTESSYGSNITDWDTRTTNSSYAMENKCPDLSLPIFYIITQVVYAIICVVGLVGNTLVIYVVLRYSKMQTVTNMYILNLAIADECFLIGLPFLITTISLKYWVFGNITCKAYMISTGINQFTSSVFLFIMSADRYVAVCHPITSPRMRTPFISRVVSAVAWTASVLFMMPIYLYTNLIKDEESNRYSCNIIWPGNMDGETMFTLYSFVLGFAVPLVLIFVFYCLVIRKLKTVGPKNKSKEKKRSHRKVTKLVLTVITVYVMCWLPYWVFQVGLIYSPHSVCTNQITVTFILIASCFSYSNSAMNPILYAFLSDNFKKSFMKACTCAAGNDVNAALHIENSVFPRKNKAGASKMLGPTRSEGVALVSRSEHSTAITVASRSNSTTIDQMKTSTVMLNNGVQRTQV